MVDGDSVITSPARRRTNIVAGLKGAANVAIRHDSSEGAICREDAPGSQGAEGHRNGHLLKRVVRLDPGNLIAAMHHFAHADVQISSQLADAVEPREVLRRKPAGLHQRDGQRVAYRQCDG